MRPCGTSFRRPVNSLANISGSFSQVTNEPKQDSQRYDKINVANQNNEVTARSFIWNRNACSQLVVCNIRDYKRVSTAPPALQRMGSMLRLCVILPMWKTRLQQRPLAPGEANPANNMAWKERTTAKDGQDASQQWNRNIMSMHLWTNFKFTPV